MQSGKGILISTTSGISTNGRLEGGGRGSFSKGRCLQKGDGIGSEGKSILWRGG